MFPLPITGWIMIALSVAALGGIGYGKFESVKYDAYVAKAELAAKEQELINKAKAKEANQVTEKVKNDYQNKLDLIKRTYGGLRLSSSGQTGAIPNSTSGANAESTNLLLDCASTTQQLVSLQAWLSEQIGIFNAK
jgi:hypothetical protein